MWLPLHLVGFHLIYLSQQHQNILSPNNSVDVIFTPNTLIPLLNPYLKSSQKNVHDISISAYGKTTSYILKNTTHQRSCSQFSSRRNIIHAHRIRFIWRNFDKSNRWSIVMKKHNQSLRIQSLRDSTDTICNHSCLKREDITNCYHHFYFSASYTIPEAVNPSRGQISNKF